MSKADELWEQIYQTTHSPREVIVAYVKELTKEAKALPADERETRDARGDEIVSSIIHAIAMQDWIDEESADDLEEILAVAGDLEINIDDHKLWQELFDLVDKLA